MIKIHLIDAPVQMKRINVKEHIDKKDLLLLFK